MIAIAALIHTRCGYGGCIDEKNRCDGNIDCNDESDENYLLCKYGGNNRPRYFHRANMWSDRAGYLTHLAISIFLGGYPKGGRPKTTTTTTTTIRPFFDPNKVYYENPFSDVPRGVCLCQMVSTPVDERAH